MFKRFNLLFSVMLVTSNLKEEIEEMKLWEKNKHYSSVYYDDVRLSNEFEKELSNLNLNEHKKVLYMRELIKEHREINARLLEKQREYFDKKRKKEMSNLPNRIKRIEEDLEDVKMLLSRQQNNN